MAQCVVVSDDLTGGNAAGVLLGKAGFNTRTVFDPNNDVTNCDCVICPVSSRGVSAREAYGRVYNAVRSLRSKDVRLYSKRIDTTLRGNLGSETDALLDALNNGATALVVPCFPQAGRIQVGGYLLVDGVPLHKTAAAHDPKNPVRTSDTALLFKSQSKYPVSSLCLEALAKGKEHISRRIKELRSDGARVIIFDCISLEDVELIADAALYSEIPFVSVDPGVFTTTLAKRLIVPEASEKRRVLAVIGSTNPVARAQVDELLRAGNVWNAFMNIDAVLNSEQSREKELLRITDTLLSGSGDAFSVIGEGVFPERRVDFEPYTRRLNCEPDALSNIINDALAEVAYRVFSADGRFAGIYTCGGDVTIAVCKRMSALGIRLLDEVLPLAAYGKLDGGDFADMKIITKGGMVGGANAVCVCVDCLKSKLS